METYSALAHCKINLGLDVLGIRPDGYHDLRTVMIKLGLADVIRICWQDHAQSSEELEELFSPRQISISSTDPHLPTGSGNLAYKAAHEYLNALSVAGLGALMPETVEIHIEKRIPYGAGLGGGSSDAATTLAVMHSMARDNARRNHCAKTSRELEDAIDLPGIALRIGSDAPFFLSGVAGLAEGRGERLTPFSLRQRLFFVCAMPQGQLLTRDVFAAFDENGSEERPDIDLIVSALQSRRLHLLRSAVYNSLEKAATILLPAVREVRCLVESTRPLCSAMSGSGSCVYGLYGDRGEAERAATVISRDPRVSWCVVTESLSEE